MKILIIGGNSFFGKLLAQKLINRKYDVSLLNRGNLDDGLGENVTRIKCDRNKRAELQRALEGRHWDLIYDQSCYTREQARLACEVFAQKTQKYIFTSSQVVYGLGADLTESAFDPRTYACLGDAQEYAQGKRQAEATFFQQAQWPVIAARLPIVIGQAENDPSARLWFHIARMRNESEIHFLNPNAKLSLISDEAAAESLAFLSEVNNFSGPINCAPQAPITIAEFKSILEAVVGVQIKSAPNPSVFNHSPYSVSQDWYMNANALANLGHCVAPIRSWLPELILDSLRNPPKHRLRDEFTVETLEKDAVRSDLNGRVIVITGSSSGVGRALALGLAELNARVVVNGKNQQKVDWLVRLIRSAGKQALGVCADISTPEGAEQLIDSAVSTFGKVDVLINNAMVLGPVEKPFWEYEPEDWLQTHDVNVNGAFLCSRAAARWMMVNKTFGRIINVCSGITQAPTSRVTAYAVGKSALEALTLNMAAQIGWKGIAISGISLGLTKTPRLCKLVQNFDELDLPSPSSVLPAFEHAITAPVTQVHGRILAAWRYNQDTQAESLLAKPLSTTLPFELNRLFVEGVELARDKTDVVMLDRGESLFGMSPNARQFLSSQGASFDATSYPATNHYAELSHWLSESLNLAEESFVFGPGSDEILDRIIRTFTRPGDQVICNSPTYAGFEHKCHAQGVNLDAINIFENSETPSHRLNDIAASIRPFTRLIYLVSPGNPVGITIKKREFVEFLQRVPQHIPIVVDEAYVEFSTDNNTLLSHEIVPLTDHVIIGVRTFSKLYGLAGLRIGYAFSRPDIARLLKRSASLFSVSSLSAAAAAVAIRDKNHVTEVRRKFHQEKCWVQKRLTIAGIKYIDVDTPFMPVASPIPIDDFIQFFQKEDIYLPGGAIAGSFFKFPLGNPRVSKKIVDTLLKLQGCKDDPKKATRKLSLTQIEVA